MEFGLLDFLDGISPWWWITLGVVLIGLEMTTMSFFLIWPGIAAVVIAILLWIAPGMSGEAQVALFAVLSVAFTWVGRTIIVRRYGLPVRRGISRDRRGALESALRDGEGRRRRRRQDYWRGRHDTSG